MDTNFLGEAPLPAPAPPARPSRPSKPRGTSSRGRGRPRKTPARADAAPPLAPALLVPPPPVTSQAPAPPSGSLEAKISLLLIPITPDATAAVQSTGHNPNLQLLFKAKRTVGSVARHLSKKWFGGARSLQLIDPAAVAAATDGTGGQPQLPQLHQQGPSSPVTRPPWDASSPSSFAQEFPGAETVMLYYSIVDDQSSPETAQDQLSAAPAAQAQDAGQRAEEQQHPSVLEIVAEQKRREDEQLTLFDKSFTTLCNEFYGSATEIANAVAHYEQPAQQQPAPSYATVAAAPSSSCGMFASPQRASSSSRDSLFQCAINWSEGRSPARAKRTASEMLGDDQWLSSPFKAPCMRGLFDSDSASNF
eukprot:m51a1_g12300 hypothetical protein (363) ;mRNA; r:332890-334182